MNLGHLDHWEPSCIVPDDPGEIVRGARPLTEADRAQLREQNIARMTYDPVAVHAREVRIAIEQSGGKVRRMPTRTR